MLLGSDTPLSVPGDVNVAGTRILIVLVPDRVCVRSLLQCWSTFTERDLSVMCNMQYAICEYFALVPKNQMVLSHVFGGANSRLERVLTVLLFFGWTS